MSDDDKRNGDPTEVYRPFDEGSKDESKSWGEPTRLDKAVGPDDESPTTMLRPTATASTAQSTPDKAPEGRRHLDVAPLVTVALLCLLAGIAIGFLLFHNSGTDVVNNPTTTTTSVPSTTSTTIAERSTTSSSSSTTQRELTTTTTSRRSTSATTSTPTTAHKSTSSSSSSSTSTTG